MSMIPVQGIPLLEDGARDIYESGKIYPAIQSIFSPPLLALVDSLGKAGQDFAFLDSGSSYSKISQHSFLSMNPVMEIRLSATVRPFEQLRDVLAKWPGWRRKDVPFFTGGAVGCLQYELNQALEGIVPAPGELCYPYIWLKMFRDLVVVDIQTNSAYLVTNLIPSLDGSFAEALDFAAKRRELFFQDIELSERAVTLPSKGFGIQDFRAHNDQPAFEKMVRKAKKYIRAGDIYQANLSQEFSFTFSGNPLQLYDKLRKINPSPFGCYLKMGSVSIVSSSPERLVHLDGEDCSTRPIAGTRRRVPKDLEAQTKRNLLISPKERAEHSMLVDLERNDLGRVCRYDSVQVEDWMELEAYSHVFHIVSSVVGKLQKEKDGMDLLEAVFPGGTITGCPKVRSMQIISELESSPRLFYTGSAGYIGFCGKMDWNILIRTIVLDGAKGSLRAGAGIVQDSNPAREYHETLAKAEALIEALGVQCGQ